MRRIGNLVLGVAWAYLAVLVIGWLIMRWSADRWWVATLVVFGPRWVFSLPLIALVPAVAFACRRRQAVLVLIASAAVWLFAIMGFCVPWQRAIPHHKAAFHLRLMTFNIHRHLVPSAMGQLLMESNPDVIVFQEWTHAYEPLFYIGWQTSRNDELCVFSKYPIERVDNAPIQDWPQPGVLSHYQLRTPGGIVHLLNVHTASPHMPFEAALEGEPNGPVQINDNSETRRAQSALLSRYALSLNGPVLIAGDFNTPVQSPIFRDSWAGFTDAFSRAGFGFGYSYYARLTAVRIDHVLSNDAWRCTNCYVAPDAGSPHRAVIADLELKRR
jgi:endonuclease/exonuclease/phosphatase (EEP) superfamily protein YafD